jgi:uncharacterized protein (TIGR03435 family)
MTNGWGGRTMMMRKPMLVILVASLHMVLLAQTASPAPATPAGAVAAPLASPTSAFEVTIVKPSKSGESGSDSSFRSGRFIASNVSLKNVIQYQAYGVPEIRIVGGPKWLNSARFDIEAKTDDAVVEQLRTLDRDQRRRLTQGMFQQLLADRFKLSVHWETRELPVYDLVVARKDVLQPEKHPENGVHTSASTGTFSAEGVTMTDLARSLTQELSRELGRVIVDKTGIEGRYDVALKWTPDEGQPSADNGSVDAGPSLLTAIQEQLGLKLESSKGPVQVLVIDHVEMPTEN